MGLWFVVVVSPWRVYGVYVDMDAPPPIYAP